MKKRLMFVSVALALALSFLASGCTKKRDSNALSENEKESQAGIETEEINESQEEVPQGVVKYKSLIDKYIGEKGTPYKAYYEILKWDDYNDTIACMCPAEEWLDADGRLCPPFDCDVVMKNGSTSYAYFYVPDELAAKAPTGELADICLRYSAMCALIGFSDIEYSGFEFMVNHSNAMEESLRRDDFAGEYLERYMTYMEDDTAVPKYFENVDTDKYDFSYSYDRKMILSFIGIILAQPEAYEQLADEEREMLVREELKMCLSPKHSFSSYFFACITGEYYTSDKMGECIWGKNPWIDFIKGMDLSEDERNEVERFFDI